MRDSSSVEKTRDDILHYRTQLLLLHHALIAVEISRQSTSTGFWDIIRKTTTTIMEWANPMVRWQI
jgi:hypothetical protein